MKYAAPLAALLLSACTLGPDYHPPATPAGATGPFVSAGTATSPQPVPDRWWELYQDPELDRLIQQSFAANQDLTGAEANLAASRAILERARTGLYPQTEITSAETYGRDPTTDEILEIAGHKPETIWLDDTILDASYELDLFGHVRRSIEAARDNAAATTAALDMLRVTLAAETARAYGQICTLGEQLRVAQQALDIANHQFKIVQNQESFGAATPFDVTRQSVLVANQRAALPPIEGQRRAALFELTALLGATPSQAPQDVLSCATPPKLSTLIPVGDGAALLKRRPDIREADRKYAAALAEVGVATADLFPRVTIGGFYGGANTSMSTLFDNNGLAWGVGPAIKWSFPNLQGPLDQLTQAKAQSRGALAAYRSVVLNALKETEQALVTYRAELDHHAALADAQTAANRAYGQAEDQYKAGSISVLDVLTAEQTLISADAALAGSDGLLVQDQIGLFKALGGGWEK